MDTKDRSGGVAVLWKNTLTVIVFNYSLNFINLEIIDVIRGNWHLTIFYGFPDRTMRRDSCSLLRRLAGMSLLPWCVIGDFNDLLSEDDKRGRVEHPQWLFNGFRSAMLDCN